MATVYSIQKTKWEQDTPTTKIKPNEMAGRRRVAYGEYEAAAIASGTVIEMFNLPNGARILSGELTYDALDSSSTLSVGHAAYKDAAGTVVALDVDEYKAAAASTTAQSVAVAATIALGKNSVVDADEDGILITVVTGGATLTGTIMLAMEYVVD
jgi:type IV secretory pathway VirB4 component|tara:strand:- start:3101 stop:3565 length:465 start_codon:yes stop_codon:yes gene_type:complete